MPKKIVGGILAGMMVSIGGMAYLACDVKYVGAVLFAVALLCICWRGYSLFTGKIGFMAVKHGREEFNVLLTGLLGNLIGTVLCGVAVRIALPALGETALTMCTAKLLQTAPATVIRGAFCGMLMYLAVAVYKENNSLVGTLFCIPVFILSGFEHSIADMFYFTASGIVSLQAFLFIWLVILGNTAGALLLCAMEKYIKF